MTATRMGWGGRALTLAVGAAAWLLAARALWDTQVPADLRLPDLDPVDVFSERDLRESASFEQFLRVLALIELVATGAAVAVLAWRAPRLVRGIELGRIGVGIVIGVLTLVVVVAVSVPFSLAGYWWKRRHDLAEGSYLEALLTPWAQIAFQVVFGCFAIAVVMGLAIRFERRWWLPGALVFCALAVFFQLAFAPVLSLGAKTLRERGCAAGERWACDPVAASIDDLEERTGAGDTKVLVQEMSRVTKQANAYAVGIGPSERVVLWDTMLGGEFSTGEGRAVLAHELAHISRLHLHKGLAWFALFALPGAFVIARVTARRGGMSQPENVPLALLALLVIQFATTPVYNVVSRRYEAEADWVALEATRDPEAVADLFRGFTHASLADPDPPAWTKLVFETHPSILDRVAMARAWRDRPWP